LPNFSSCPATAGAAGEQKECVMKDAIDQNDDEILAYEVADDALEAAASAGDGKAANYTLAYCSGLSVCPASSS